MLNEIRSTNTHIFDEWGAKDIVCVAKSLQFNINKIKVIITQLPENKYNIKYGKQRNNNIAFEDIVPIISKYSKE